MDLELLALVAMIVGVVLLATRHNRHAWPGRPGWQYQRVFSFGFVGLLLLISGLMGFDVSHSHGWFRGAVWVDAVVWWQVGLGAVMVLLAGFWATRVPVLPTNRSRTHSPHGALRH